MIFQSANLCAAQIRRFWQYGGFDMITRQFSLEQMPDDCFERDFNINKIVFFDIETTGLSADTSYLYLIGCAYYEKSSFQLIQWFSEDIKEEILLITSFFEFLNDYSILIHYNGTGFDIPYIQRKCILHNLNYSFDHLTSIDIYKKVLPYKKLLGLDSLKLKSLEAFLKVHRKDTSNGGDLIEVYQFYLGKKHYEKLKKMRTPSIAFPSPTEAELLLEQLLLHNEDDLRGLLHVSPMLNYEALFKKPIRIRKAEVELDNLNIIFELSGTLPVKIQFGNELMQIMAYDYTGMLSVRIYEGELKHFYDNYKDYYYLPAEDMAVHKSLAQYVDKAFREKAKPSSCYIKKQGLFAPQYEAVINPYFKKDYKDKLSYIEIHTDFLLQEEVLEHYVKHMLLSNVSIMPKL